MDRASISLVIEGIYLEKIPFKAALEYLKDFEILLDSRSYDISMKEVKSSSIAVRAEFPEANREAVINDIREAAVSGASGQKANAYRRIHTRCTNQGAKNAKIISNKEVIVKFPKKLEERKIRVVQITSVQGKVVRLGGEDQTAHIILKHPTGSWKVECTIEFGKRLRKHLWESVRIAGKGTWIREPSGDWELEKLRAESFEPLNDMAFDEALDKITNLPGFEKSRFDDAEKFMENVRGLGWREE